MEKMHSGIISVRRDRDIPPPGFKWAIFFYSGSSGIRRNKDDASLCWQRFMALDKARRQNDPQDFFWEKSNAPRMASYVESYGRNAVLLRAKPVLREIFRIVCGSGLVVSD